MTASINNNTATLSCYTSPIPTPSNRSANFDVTNPNTWMISSASIVVIHLDEINLNKKIISLLEEFSNLQNNWDEDEAIAPDENTLSKAKSLVYTLEKRGQKIYHAAPGPNGEIMLDIRNPNRTKSLEIIFYINKSVVVSFPEKRTPFQNSFSVLDLPDLLNWLDQK
jgi:hypothetical protein